MTFAMNLFGMYLTRKHVRFELLVELLQICGRALFHIVVRTCPSHMSYPTGWGLDLFWFHIVRKGKLYTAYNPLAESEDKDER